MITELANAILDHPLAAYVGSRRNDPAAIFYFLLMWLGSQLIVWLVGKDSLDTDWWRSAALAAISTVVPAMVIIVAANEGVAGLVAAGVLIALVIWIISGMLYEPEFLQRLLISLLIPALAGAAFPFALWLRECLVGPHPV